MIPLNTPREPYAGLPIMADNVDVYELISITARLKDLLARETEYLKKMQINEIAKLQDEKKKLTATMEAYQALLSKRPELMRAMDEARRAELAELTDEFSRVVAENMRRTAVARAVNQRVVAAIMEVVSENQHAGTYNKYGSAALPGGLSVSFNLNQKA